MTGPHARRVRGGDRAHGRARAERPGYGLLHASLRDGGGFVGGCGAVPAAGRRRHRDRVSAAACAAGARASRPRWRARCSRTDSPRSASRASSASRGPRTCRRSACCEKIGMRRQADAVHYGRTMRVYAAARAVTHGAARRWRNAGWCRSMRRCCSRTSCSAIAPGSSRIATTSLRATQADAFFALAKRRREGEPVAYLTGTREFWGLPLRVSRAVLIPRPETETLVELALEWLPRDRRLRVLDLGTGSGAIALAIAHERPRAHVMATDVSSAALAVARDNATRLGLRQRRVRGIRLVGRLAGSASTSSSAIRRMSRAGDPHLAEGDLRFEPRVALVAARRRACGAAHDRRERAGTPGAARRARGRARLRPVGGRAGAVSRRRIQRDRRAPRPGRHCARRRRASLMRP